jgi:hypothetical protein
VTFLFGASRDPRRDKELRAGNERTRRALARDINDEHALAFGAGPRQRRRGFWMIYVVLGFLVLGGLGLLPRPASIPIGVSCSEPGLALRTSTARPGALVGWRATGPDSVDYVLAVDANEVSGPAGAVRVDTGGAVSPTFQMRRCQTGDAQFAAPTDGAMHTIRLFAKRGGRYVAVASAPLTVSG